MDKSYLTSEASAPIFTDEALPLTVSTLQYIPEERRVQYGRQMDGTFRLRFLTREDEASINAHVINANPNAPKIPVLKEGETPESVAAEGKRKEQQVADILKKADLDDANRRELERARAREKAEIALSERYGPPFSRTPTS